MEKPSGGLMVLKGDNELSVLKEMDVEKAEVFVTSIQTSADIGKAILLLSSLQKELNHISEGLILKEILKFGQYNQKQLAEQLMKSEAWISKRLSLAEKLNDNVATMVLDRTLCPSVAQNIARLPKDRQHTFAMKIYSNNIPKLAVEKLVSAYGNKNTPDVLKEEIINNPLNAMENINTTGVKNVGNKGEDDSKFQGSLRLLIKLIANLEAFFARWEKEKLLKYSALLGAVETSLSRFLVLIQQRGISPGKSSSQEGGNAHGSC
ncbi:hypothetical protein LPY66_00420 [Dehalobacter sp. DCM]|uniref:hypothetical protein n=1 Tax=Dehalobacter sp. DCM TaxID=2907827 RepID=UPI0030815D9B|nr:hypothetical protein LPY66_00420 [Dehalobacter sp. DCM]